MYVKILILDPDKQIESGLSDDHANIEYLRNLMNCQFVEFSTEKLLSWTVDDKSTTKVKALKTKQDNVKLVAVLSKASSQKY